jgi:SAM-dependent methyltransferase
MKDIKGITINSYDKTAVEYYKRVSEFELLPEITEFIKTVKTDGKILDLGCGPGHHSKYFSSLGFDVVGIDLSIAMIEIARRESVKSVFHVMDILELNFEKGTFDGIWASASLLHVPKIKMKFVLKKLKEILVDNGILYISLKQGEGSEIFIDNRYGGVEKYYVYYDPEEIEKLLKNVGFNIIEIQPKDKRTIYDTNSWIHIFCQKLN